MKSAFRSCIHTVGVTGLTAQWIHEKVLLVPKGITWYKGWRGERRRGTASTSSPTTPYLNACRICKSSKRMWCNGTAPRSIRGTLSAQLGI